MYASLFNTTYALFDAMRHRRLACFCTEPINNTLQTINFFALLSGFFRLARFIRFARYAVLRVGATVFNDRSFGVFIWTIKMQHSSNRFV